jgi:hypothetical protein
MSDANGSKTESAAVAKKESDRDDMAADDITKPSSCSKSSKVFTIQLQACQGDVGTKGEPHTELDLEGRLVLFRTSVGRYLLQRLFTP